MAAFVLALLLAIAPAVEDRGETREAREERLRPWAEAIAAATSNPIEARALVVLGTAETHWGSRILAGDCSLDHCDGGRARGAWQLHPWCTAETTAGEARCAIGALRFHGARCQRIAGTAGRTWAWWVGAFSGYADGHSCDRRQSRERAGRVWR